MRITANGKGQSIFEAKEKPLDLIRHPKPNEAVLLDDVGYLAGLEYWVTTELDSTSRFVYEWRSNSCGPKEART